MGFRRLCWILSTKVLDRDERLVVIPNNTLVESKSSTTLVVVAMVLHVVFRLSLTLVLITERTLITSSTHCSNLQRSVHTSSTSQSHEFCFTNLQTLRRSSVSTHGSKITATSMSHVTGSCATLTSDLVRKTSTFHSQHPLNCPIASTRQAEVTKQRSAKRKMVQERKKLDESRINARNEIEEINEKLKDAELSKKDRAARRAST